MTWNETTRPQYRRESRRYTSDLTDAEWALIEPMMPLPSAVGRPRATKLRSVVDAILYIGSTGCQWRQLPKDFPPYSTVQGYFYDWAEEGRFASINHLLVVQAREAAGREASPSAGVIDSQSVRRPRVAVHAATTPGRRSWDANATSSPIHKETLSASSSMTPGSKIATERQARWRRSDYSIPGCGASLPMAAMLGQSSGTR
jgi:transposase